MCKPLMLLLIHSILFDFKFLPMLSISTSSFPGLTIEYKVYTHKDNFNVFTRKQENSITK